MVSCIFTLTDDLDAEFPAVAARALGLSRVPLLCAREVPVPGSLPHVIRVLVHYYAPEDHEPAARVPGGGARAPGGSWNRPSSVQVRVRHPGDPRCRVWRRGSASVSARESPEWDTAPPRSEALLP